MKLYALRSMLYALCSTLLALCSVLFCCPSAFAEGPSAWLNINYTNTEQLEDGKKTESSDNLFQNYYFRFDKSITPVLSYQLYLRTTLTNSHTSDAAGNTTTTYQRAVEPALDIFFRNPMYGLEAGYRRLEQWSTAHLREDSRRTTEFYYSRFNITPREFPFLSLQFDRQRDFDYLPTRKIDSTNTRYSGSSWYDLLYKDIKLSYNITYTRNENQTPINIISKTIDNTLNGLYNLGYNRSFWGGKVNVSASYQGNYVRNKSDKFATQTGNVPFKRTASSGLYGQGTQLQPTVDTLALTPSLTDSPPTLTIVGDIGYITPAISSTINIGQNGSKFHNIGIQLSSFDKPVDTLFIYVNKDVRSDTNLTNTNNWKVYWSNSNLPLTWTEITIQSVTPSAFDTLNNIYRYEIRFSTPQSARFFRAINMDTAFSINDVLVTEIEAYGTDFISSSGKITDTSTFFTQGISFNANLRPIDRLTFSFNYFLNRSDQNPKSVLDSIGGAFTNIFSKSKTDQEEKLKSYITRSYGATSTWLTHRLLTTTLRFQRSETFDNKDETDISSNTYSLVFSSSPLPTLDANLSLIRTYSFSFDEKQSMNTLYFLTIGSRLYRDVNMITDIGYTKSETYAIDTESSTTTATKDTRTSTRYIRGTLDARLTPELSGNLTYGFSRMSGSTSSSLKDGSIILTYRPGRFINITGSFRVSDTDSDTTTSEGLLVDWLPLPAIRLNLNYEHRNTKTQSTTIDLISAQSTTIDSISGYVIWYITKFMDVQLTSNYSRNVNEKKTEIYSIGGNLTCRFW